MQLIHFPNILWLIFLLFSTISSDRNSVQQQHEDQKAEIVSLAAKHRLKREMPLNLPRDILTNRRKYRPRNQNTQLHSSVPVNKICTIKHNVIILFDARVNRQAFKEQIDLMKDFVYNAPKKSFIYFLCFRIFCSNFKRAVPVSETQPKIPDVHDQRPAIRRLFLPLLPVGVNWHLINNLITTISEFD